MRFQSRQLPPVSPVASVLPSALRPSDKTPFAWPPSVATNAPLLTVQIFDGPKLALDGMQAILATSANGVRALAVRSDARDVPVFAVGPQTADAASQAGFIRVRNADGDAVALADAVSGWADPKAGALLHAAGAEGRPALTGRAPVVTAWDARNNAREHP